MESPEKIRTSPNVPVKNQSKNGPLEYFEIVDSPSTLNPNPINKIPDME